MDDRVNGLTEDQKQLRETIFNFCQKELAPHADAIDKADDFPQRGEFWRTSTGVSAWFSRLERAVCPSS